MGTALGVPDKSQALAASLRARLRQHRPRPGRPSGRAPRPPPRSGRGLCAPRSHPGRTPRRALRRAQAGAGRGSRRRCGGAPEACLGAVPCSEWVGEAVALAGGRLCRTWGDHPGGRWLEPAWQCPDRQDGGTPAGCGSRGWGGLPGARGRVPGGCVSRGEPADVESMVSGGHPLELQGGLRCQASRNPWFQCLRRRRLLALEGYLSLGRPLLPTIPSQHRCSSSAPSPLSSVPSVPCRLERSGGSLEP